MLTPSTFRCDRKCADCCKYLTVKLSKKDISAIKREGYDEKAFMGFDCHIGSYVLKLNDEGCIFLGEMNGKYYCRIYSIRPKVCRQYPFVNSNEIESCKPELLKYKFKNKKRDM